MPDRFTARLYEPTQAHGAMRQAWEQYVKPLLSRKGAPPMVLEVIRSIEAKGSLEMASKTLQRIAAVFRFAIQTGRATYNPAADMRGALKAKKVEHHKMISPDELPEFLKALAAGQKQSDLPAEVKTDVALVTKDSK